MIQSSLGDVGLGKFRLVKFVEFTLPNQLFKPNFIDSGASNQAFLENYSLRSQNHI